eukprot:1478524-Alexandrium_andersonii.AAC.1
MCIMSGFQRSRSHPPCRSRSSIGRQARLHFALCEVAPDPLEQPSEPAPAVALPAPPAPTVVGGRLQHSPA